MDDSRDLLSIPVIPLEDILGEYEPQVDITISKPLDGQMPIDQEITLLGILIKEQPKEVLEIGTYNGHTTYLMAKNLKNSIIHTVDLPLDFDFKKEQENTTFKDDFSFN
jgi:hypothetical protein